MRSKFFLWLVASLIGVAFAFPPMISAAEKAEKKAAAQPCGPLLEKKEEKKEEKKAKKKAEKKTEKKEEKKAQKKEEKKEK